MTTTSARSGSRRAAAALSAGSLALLALAAVPPPAGAVSPSIGYTCTSTEFGTFTLPVVLDTNAPSRMIVGETTPVVAVTKSTLQPMQAKQASDWGATTVVATLTTRTTFGTAAVSPTAVSPRSTLGDQTTPKAVEVTGASDPFSFTAPPALGPLDVTAGDISGTLSFYSALQLVKQVPVTCAAPSGKPPVIDSIAVAASTSTMLTLSKTTSAYGEEVVASAKVASSYGIPAGQVAFAVEGVVTRAKVNKDGIASLVLPAMEVDVRRVVATFVPSDPATYPESSSPVVEWTVAPVATALKVPVTGRTTKTVTRVGVKAQGRYDTVPTGKVRIKVKRLGKPGKWARVRTLSAAGTARIGLSMLAAGRYRAVVIYKGDTNHLGARKVKTFRVKQR